MEVLFIADCFTLNQSDTFLCFELDKSDSLEHADPQTDKQSILLCKCMDVIIVLRSLQHTTLLEPLAYYRLMEKSILPFHIPQFLLRPDHLKLFLVGHWLDRHTHPFRVSGTIQLQNCSATFERYTQTDTQPTTHFWVKF